MQTLEDVIAYLEGVATRYAPVASFAFGFSDEQGLGGATLYPHVFLEAEMEVSESNPGLAAYSTALLFLVLPEQQGTQPGTRSERALLNEAKQYADEFIEILRMEQVLYSLKAASWLSLSGYGNDSAYGWRVEVSFEAMKQLDRNDIKTRFTPLA